MDAKDRHILDLLQEDASLAQAKIGRRVGLSAAAVNERIRRLETDGVIRKWTVLVDDRKVGADMTVFVAVFIDNPKHEDSFVRLMEEIPEVQECHFVTGEFSCLVKAKVADRSSLRQLVLERINSLPGVRQTWTFIALETTKEECRVPLVEPPGPEGAAKRRGGSR